jgi:von Willebrand factor type A domain/Putative Flp pilus-assembly TadE/G-like
MPDYRRERCGERGFVIHMYAFMMLFIIIPMVGLAIDAGILYTIKGKLQTAVDGAALGAARSLNRGQDISSQEASATDAATRYYHANFPRNWMGVTTVADPNVDWSHSTASTAVIDVTGNIDAPTWFMKILHFDSVHLTVFGEAVRRNVNIMLVIDRSSSLQVAGNCPALISSSQTFVNSFANNRDRMSLVTFGSYYNNDYPFNYVFRPNLSNLIGNLVCAGTTNGSGGFSYAYSILKGLNDHGALNVILFFTDGQPNTVTFGPAYGNGSGPKIQRKTTGSCSSTTGFSGAMGGDTTNNFQYGILLATNSTYPAPTGGDWGTSYAIGAAQGWTGGCQFRSNTANYYNDIAAIPATDAWGNSVNTTWSGGSGNGFPYTVNLTGVTSTSSIRTNLENGGINALDNAAHNARVDANTNDLPYIVYTIGLGSVNDELLKRVANDAGAGKHESAYTTGKYVKSPTGADLAAAFAEIASDILRLAK